MRVWLIAFFVNIALVFSLYADDVIYYDTDKGMQLLAESEYKNDFYRLAASFETQLTQSFCGVASSITVLNALTINDVPIAATYSPYRWFTQDNVFTEQQLLAAFPTQIMFQGMTLAELQGLVLTYVDQAQRYHADELTIEQMKTLLIATLQQDHQYILLNYLRRELGQEGGGHISPVVAYHQESDRFLILDVARYRYAPTWVTTEMLWQAIQAEDSVSGRSRGFILVS